MIQIDSKFAQVALSQKSDSFLPKARARLRDLLAGRCAGADFLGWLDLPRRGGYGVFTKLKSTPWPDNYDAVVVIGIGGSYLGTRAISAALGPSFESGFHKNPSLKPLYFSGHHLHEAELKELLQLLEQKRVLVNVISKSGTTTEPAAAFRIIRAQLKEKYGEKVWRSRLVITTDEEKGSLHDFAQKEGILSFSIPGNVGGRFSVLSAVGLVPLFLAGYDVKAFLDGADAYFQTLSASSAQQAEILPAMRYAALRRAAFDLGLKVELLAYSNPKLFYFCEWWRQLFAESEGKAGNGLFPAGFPLTTDLHSVGQMVQDGPKIFLETFLELNEVDNAERDELCLPAGAEEDGLSYLSGRPLEFLNQSVTKATMMAHQDAGNSCLQIQAGMLCEETLGELVAFFETSCALSSLLFEVNPFDQPGVEAYKKNLFALLGKPGFEELGYALKKRLQ